MKAEIGATRLIIVGHARLPLRSNAKLQSIIQIGFEVYVTLMHENALPLPHPLLAEGRKLTPGGWDTRCLESFDSENCSRYPRDPGPV